MEGIARNLEGIVPENLKRVDDTMRTARDLIEGLPEYRTVIHRTKAFPILFLAMSLVPLTVGIFLLLLSIRLIITNGAAGFVILALGMSVVVASVWFVMWNASLLKPARISFDPERIQYIENGSIKKEIQWDDKTVIGPQFNHALG
ncbi:MAG: hypothetical protein V3U51_01170, partial [Thermoplasmata archaeon]